MLDEAKVELRTGAEEAKTALTNALSEAQDRLDATIQDTDKDLADARQRAQVQHESLANEGQARIKLLDELVEKAEATVGVIGIASLAAGYKKVADDERKAANIWRLVTAATLTGAIGATAFAVVHGLSVGFEVSTFLAKWAISIPFLAFAAYAGRESAKHREQARVNRQMELQLASLDAYLVTLPQDQQYEIRGKLAYRFFSELHPTPEQFGPPEPE